MQGLSTRELHEKIKSHEYERLPNKITEYDLKNMILHNIDGFLRNIGNGFMYVGN